MQQIDEIVADFESLDDWEDRYRYLIELGRDLPRLGEAERTDANKVQGCASQVWLIPGVDSTGAEPRLTWRGESDAHIVQGLIAVLLTFYSGRTPRDALRLDALGLFRRIGLADHLTPQRSNGLRSMVERIRADAHAALAAAG